MGEDKKTLRAVVPVEYELMGPDEALTKAGFVFTADESGLHDIVCKCGEKAVCTGWIGTESVYCRKCRTGIQDMTGIVPSGKNTAGMLEVDYDEAGEKVWTPHNIWGWH